MAFININAGLIGKNGNKENSDNHSFLYIYFMHHNKYLIINLKKTLSIFLEYTKIFKYIRCDIRQKLVKCDYWFQGISIIFETTLELGKMFEINIYKLFSWVLWKQLHDFIGDFITIMISRMCYIVNSCRYTLWLLYDYISKRK